VVDGKLHQECWQQFRRGQQERLETELRKALGPCDECKRLRLHLVECDKAKLASDIRVREMCEALASERRLHLEQRGERIEWVNHYGKLAAEVEALRRVAEAAREFFVTGDHFDTQGAGRKLRDALAALPPRKG
jgi:hypothetical protein